MPFRRLIPFAAFFPLGPREEERQRLIDSVQSLVHHEPSVAHLVIVDDSDDATLTPRSLPVPSTCTVAVLRHPRTNRQFDVNSQGGLCVATLTALRYAYDRLQVRFVLKLDTDALVIGPCAEAIDEAFARDPAAGIFGTLGDSCNRATRSLRGDDRLRHTLRRAVEISNAGSAPGADDLRQLEEWGVTSREQREAFSWIVRPFAPLAASGYGGEHCQGGSYAISSSLIAAMAAAGFLDNPLQWNELPFGEDRMMGLYSALLGFGIKDLSEDHQPFGVQAWGLAYAPDELAARGYGIIHSVRTDERYPEAEVRQYFRLRRRGPVPVPESVPSTLA